MKSYFSPCVRFILGFFLTAGLTFTLSCTNEEATVETLLSFKGLKPGLCVHIGGINGELSAELASAGEYNVHGLTPDRCKIEKMREYVSSKGLYGQVAIDYCGFSHLPYPDNLVNLLVVENFSVMEQKGLSFRELMRVVAPKGSVIVSDMPVFFRQIISDAGYRDAVVNRKGMWTQVIKPRPEEIDDWSQPDHDAGCSSISQDRLVRPSNSVQWVTGYPGRHDRGLNPMLTSDGRIFSWSSDQGIVARDAFNGLMLWQRKGASLLIADNDRLFVRLENRGPLVALDAATGSTIHTYTFGGYDQSWPPLSRTAYHDGILLTGIREVIEAYDAETGEELWRKKVTGEIGPICSPLALFQDINKKRIIGEGKVFLTLTETKEFLCLDLKTGEELWRVSTEGDRLVCYRDGILFSQFMAKGSNTEEVVFNAAYFPKNGSLLWRYDYRKVWHGGHPHNVFFVNGLVWVLVSVPEDGVSWTKEPQAWHGLNPRTGEFVTSFDWKNTKHRCFADRATEKYIIAGGIDFLDVQTGEHHKFLGGRGNCSFGRMPANGLVYEGPNTCQCYSQVRGYTAFSSDAGIAELQNDKEPELLYIPGSGEPAGENPSSEDWPMLRRDPARKGSTEVFLPAELTPLWEREVGGGLSSPAVACGKIFVSSIDEHLVFALDKNTGDTVWRYRAHGRVDSPPTIYNGMALFGCRDGWVYCVSSATGELIWSLRAAPRQRWLVCRGQIESAWPVFGSILVENDTAYFAAGRHSQVDGGVFYSAASPETGEILWQKRIANNSVLSTYTIPGNVSNDILVSGSDAIFMRSYGFNPETGSRSTKRVSFRSGMAGGFLTDTFKLLHRGHEMYRVWKYLPSGISGLTLALTDEKIFGIGIGLNVSPWNVESFDTFEIFSCSKTEGVNNIFWQVISPEGVLPKAILPTGSKVYVAGANLSDGVSNGVILIYDANDGTNLGTIPLSLTPRFDGMAAVKDNLIVVGQEGKVVCLGIK